jgi:hypothetical protein
MSIPISKLNSFGPSKSIGALEKQIRPVCTLLVRDLQISGYRWRRSPTFSEFSSKFVTDPATHIQVVTSKDIVVKSEATPELRG